MSENIENYKPQMPEGLEEPSLDLSTTELSDGTQIISDQSQEEQELKEEISDKDLEKLLEFSIGVKNPSKEDLEALRNNEDELNRLARITVIKAENFNYKPKKDFNKTYRQKRKRKNKLSKQSRINNR